MISTKATTLLLYHKYLMATTANVCSVIELHYKPFSALKNIHVTQLAKSTLGHFPLQVRTGEQAPSLHESAVSIVIPCYLEILMNI
jgi:hypothetical protein